MKMFARQGSSNLDKKFEIFLIAVLALNALDISTTFLGIKYGGSEGNPIVGDPLSLSSLAVKTVFLMILTCLISFSLYYATKHKIAYLQLAMVIILCVLTVIFVLVLANNLIVLFRLLALQ